MRKIGISAKPWHEQDRPTLDYCTRLSLIVGVHVLQFLHETSFHEPYAYLRLPCTILMTILDRFLNRRGPSAAACPPGEGIRARHQSSRHQPSVSLPAAAPPPGDADMYSMLGCLPGTLE
jgi:hypothetical protein